MLLKSVVTPEELSVWSTDNITSTETLNQLYVSLVRPHLEYAAPDVSLVRLHLEYAAPVWDPHLQKDTDKLEKVQ